MFYKDATFTKSQEKTVACQHFPDDQTLRLQAGAGEDDVIHLPSGPDRVDCDRQEEEEEVIYFVLVICLRVGDLFCVGDLSPCC